MAINNNIEDPKYRKKIYDFLSTNFADFKRTETDFYKKLDTDSNYAGQVYDVISQNYSDFGRSRAEFLELMLPSKKKELSEPVSPVGGEAGTSVPPSGFAELKPAKRQPTEVIKEPKVVGEDTLLARKMERAQRPAVATTEVKLPAVPKLVAEEKAAERALAPKLEPKVAKDEQGWLANTVSALDRGFYKNLIGNPIKGLATVIQYGTEAMTGGRVKEGPVSDALNKFGDWFNNAIDEIAPQDPEFKNSLADQFTQALGQVGSIVFTGGLGAGGRAAGIATQAVPSAGRLAPAVAAGKELVSEITSPAAISAGLTMGQAEFDRAKKAGASDDQAFEAFYKNAAVGSILEKIPVMQFLKRFNNATAGGVANYIKTKGVAGITGGLEEATTEVLQQVYANKTAKDIYNTNQDIFEGLTESGGVGFGVGFLLNAMGANARLLRKQGKEAEAQLVDAQIKEFESRAEKGPEVPPAPSAAPAAVVEPETLTEEIGKRVDEIRAEEEAAPEVEDIVYYHGTTKKNAESIRKSGFKKELDVNITTDPEEAAEYAKIAAEDGGEPEVIEVRVKKDSKSLGQIKEQQGEYASGLDFNAYSASDIVLPAPQVPAAEEKTYRVEYFDPESRKMTHQMFATEAEGEAFKKTLTREQASQGVTSYFEKAPAKGVGEVAPEAAPELPAAPEKSGAGVSIQKQSDYVQEILGVSNADADVMSLIHNADLTADEKNILWRQWKRGVMSMGDIKRMTSLDLDAISQGRIDKWANAILANKKRGQKIGEDIDFEEVGEVAPEAAPQVPVEKIKPIDFSTQLENKYGVSLDLTGNLEKGDLTLSKIVVPEEKRRQGIGTSVMEDIIKYADENGKRITLTPSEDFGAESIKNLTEFYKRFGFVENKGENKDFTIKDAMYRVPQPVTAEEQLKPKEYAVQKPTTGEIPVQPESRVSEKVEAGVPPTRPPKPPKEGEVEGETGAEKKSVELSLKGIKEIANEFSIEDVEGRTRKTDIELRENAKDKIDKWVAEGSYDKNIDNLVKKAEEFDVLTDEQRIILEQHLANVRENFSNGIENGTIKAGSEEFTNGLNQIKRLLDAASKTRSAAGAALRIPIGGSVAHPLENYDTALVAKMDANSVDKLTDAQIKEVEESVRLYKEKIDAANERIKDLEDKLSQMMAEEEVGSVKKRKKAIKSKEERVAERKQAIADAREALKKIRTGEAGLSAVPIPFVREFVAISPYVKKIAQSYIEEGVDNLNLLIDKIYEDFKDDLPEMTKKDVRDIIGNQYSQRKETATEAKSKLRDLTEEARLLSLYEKLLSGEEPVSERKKVERNQRIVELRDKINEIRRRNKEQDVDYKDLKRIEDTKNRALQKAKEYKKKLDEKDFAPSEKPISIFNDTKLQKKYPKEYNEMLDAIQEREDAKHEFDIELMKDEERRQTKLQKIGRYAKMFTGTTKAIKSGIDASATLIQNFAMLSAYPKSFAKAFVNQWGDFASQKKFNRWHTAIKNNKPVWDLIQNSGLSITEPSALKEAQKEEIFSDNLLDRTFKIGDKTYNIGKYTTKPFERLFVSMGNALRVDVFLRIADKWYVEGKTFETNPEDYKSLANMLNNMTSRAKLAPAVERARDIVGTGIWSPQLMASRLNLLGISDAAMPFFGRKGYYAGLTPKVRKMQIANMAKMIGLGLSIMLLAKVSGSDDDEGDLDPVSPTFGTVKIGEKRIPVWSNYPKYIRTIAQFASGKQKIEGEYADKRRGETAQRFFRSSVPPATGTAIDIITGRDYMGKPITKEGIVKGLVMPMSLEAISKEVQRDGVLGAVTGAAQFFGLNVSDERDYVKKDDRPFDIKDPVTFKKREVTEKELEAFKKRRDEIYKELSDDYENGRKTIYLNPEDKIKLSIPSSVSDMELDSWRELYYEKLTPEQIKELYKLLMSKAKKDSKNELKLTLGEEEEKED